MSHIRYVLKSESDFGPGVYFHDSRYFTVEESTVLNFFNPEMESLEKKEDSASLTETQRVIRRKAAMGVSPSLSSEAPAEAHNHFSSSHDTLNLHYRPSFLFYA